MTPAVLTHAGGVPETLGIALPIIAFVLILRAGRRRQQREERENPPDVEHPAPPEG